MGSDMIESENGEKDGWRPESGATAAGHPVSWA